ncbi:MAG: glycine--tRNA ligase subunit beta [Anaerolineales bacterium]|nr:glycine--tRNA ligase subunit beta [Chloroflexota bacterium]MBL6983744.1 glycine--tRNA ligase subunit beta [Anaerolineales bacterium]
MKQTLDFQSIIITLQNFWNEKGCLIWQPYHTEVGAGTMNPGTVLRVLGPEPWNVAYVEPSIRPDDGRYGENPNRFYQHIQYQVILKPDPGNPQDLYLQSLVALGIDPHKHDIRFVEDNWAQPAISAWGLGWEVWLDGLEITQFTYFQQVGGQTLDPVAVELTYGLERIAMAIQGVRDFRDIRWNQSMTYGDVYLANEKESSKYAFELADVERLRQMFDLYEAEAEVCLENHQVLPAHDYVLKCSHTFNVLDTRGAVGVTERAAYFRRMRGLSRRVAEAYIEQRTRMEFPWLSKESEGAQEHGSTGEFPLHPDSPAPLLIEIGTEELPPGDLEDALKQLKDRLPALLDELRLEHGEIKVMGTPRRLVIHVDDLAPQQDDLEELAKGPPAKRAFDADGVPTKAAEGFARSKGVDVSQLEAREIDGGEYVVAVVKQDGRTSADVLTEALPKLIAEIHFVKTMRWNETNISFSRPIRWLLALHGEAIISFEYADLQAQATTHGLRFSDNEIIPIKNSENYFSEIAAQGILLDPEERKTTIEKQIQALAKKVGGEIPDDPDLLLEVTHLVEAPTALLGEFNPHHLELPDEVLISVMKKHQRYFPIEEARSAKSDVRPGTPHPALRTLLPYFITVANKPGNGAYDLVTRGNEDVIRARFADAAYFVREDMQSKLEDLVPQLEKLTFQTKLGSMLDKTKRIEGLVDVLAPMLSLASEEIATTHRAAQLCKADLATQMVVEMTSLQGVMGRDYALHSGEPEDVAIAILEHYMPRSASDSTPTSKPGLTVGLADRLDSLAGLFAAGLAPSGNKDPFALRRAALGLVGNLIAWELDFDIRQGLEAAANNLPIDASADSQTDCLEFIIGRLRQLFLDQGYAYDVVDAVVNAQGHNPAKAVQAVKELSQWVAREDWDIIFPAYSRCARITKDQELDIRYQALAETDPAEKALLEALEKAKAVEQSAGSVNDFLIAFEPMIPAVDKFFEDVLVMAEDEKVRDNRLALLQRIAALADGVADMSKLEGF